MRQFSFKTVCHGSEWQKDKQIKYFLDYCAFDTIEMRYKAKSYWKGQEWKGLQHKPVWVIRTQKDSEMLAGEMDSGYLNSKRRDGANSITIRTKQGKWMVCYPTSVTGTGFSTWIPPSLSFYLYFILDLTYSITFKKNEITTYSSQFTTFSSKIFHE